MIGGDDERARRRNLFQIGRADVGLHIEDSERASLERLKRVGSSVVVKFVIETAQRGNAERGFNRPSQCGRNRGQVKWIDRHMATVFDAGRVTWLRAADRIPSAKGSRAPVAPDAVEP